LSLTVVPQISGGTESGSGGKALRQQDLGKFALLVPPDGAGNYRNVFTAEGLTTRRFSDGIGLHMGEALSDFPMVLLQKENGY
jgi:hypothetical protein